jgi:hypothetical protein
MYDCILEEIPTTVKHDERKAEINSLLYASGVGQIPQLATFSRIRGEQEVEMVAALRNSDGVSAYTMMPDERIAERLSYLAMDIESEFHTTTTAAGVIVLTWDTFNDAYVKRMTEYIADIESLAPDEHEIAAQAGEMAYDRCKDDQA